MTLYVDKTAPGKPDTPTDGGTWTHKPIDFNWTAVTDAHSRINHYVCQIGTTPGDNDVFDGNVGTDLAKTITGTNGLSYYCRVQAVDNVGNVSAWSINSNGITWIRRCRYRG